MASLAQLVEHQIVVLGVAGSIPVTRPIVLLALKEVCMSRLCYEDMVQDALISVVKRALKEVSANGLPGDHHFYISFKTAFSGVEVPSYLLDKHPSEMMVVLQYQFDNLIVQDDHFSVSLSFNGQYERLKIPFNALVAFVDPSVKFGLQFSPKNVPNSPDDHVENTIGKSADGCSIIDFNSFKRK